MRDGGVVFTGYVGFAAQAYDLQRTVSLITGVQTLVAQPDGKTVTAGAKIGYDVDLGQGTLTPYLALDGTFISVDGYTEQGGSAALVMPDRDTDLVEGRIGAVYKGLFDMGEGSALRPKLAIAYVFDVDSDDNVSKASFLGFPSVPMTFVGSQRDDGWAEYEVGFEYEAQNIGVSLSYAGADNGVLDYGVVSGRLSVNW